MVLSTKSLSPFVGQLGGALFEAVPSTLLSALEDGIADRFSPSGVSPEWTRDLPADISRLFRRLPNQDFSGFQPASCGAPFILFLLGAVVLHGVLGYGVYKLGETPIARDPLGLNERREGLLNEAKDVLERHRRGERVDPDYLNLVVGLEALSAHQTEQEEAGLLKDWGGELDEDIASINRAAGPHNQLAYLLNRLYYEHTHHYGRMEHRLDDYFDICRGNCVARTKLIVSAIARARIDLPEGEEIGIQVYEDHVLPVLYRKGADGQIVSVTDLVSGEEVEKVVADIYSPLILYAGFMMKQGVAPPVGFEDLLIEAAKEENIAHNERRSPFDLKRDSGDIEFPRSKAVSGLDAPLDSISPPPDFSKWPASAVPSDVPSTGDAAGEEGVTEEKGEGAGGPMRDGLSVRLIEGDRCAPIDVCVDSSSRSVGFRTTTQRDLFLKMKTPEDRREFVKIVIESSLAGERKEPAYKVMLELLDDPLRTMPNLSADAVEKASRMHAQYQSALMFATSELKLYDFYCRNDQSPDEESYASLQDLPFREARNAYRKNLHDDPRSFILMLNSLGSIEQQDAAISWISVVNKYHDGDEIEGPIGPMLEILADSKLVSTSDRKAEQTEFIPPPPKPEELIWVDLAGEPAVKVASGAGAEPVDGARATRGEGMERDKESELPKGARDESGGVAPMVIDPSLMAQMILDWHDDQNGLARRWNADASAAFRRDLIASPLLRTRFRTLLIELSGYEEPPDPRGGKSRPGFFTSEVDLILLSSPKLSWHMKQALRVMGAYEAR